MVLRLMVSLFFSDWHEGMVVPQDIYIVYIIQFGYALQSSFGCVFMDHWRKDSPVMLFHHGLTMALLGFSYAMRYVDLVWNG